MKHRIEVYTQQAGNTFRELHDITKNEYGDILLTIDGGEQINFTPQPGFKGATIPKLETVKAVAQGRPRLSIIKTTDTAIWGDMRITPSAAKPEAPKPNIEPNTPKTDLMQ